MEKRKFGNFELIPKETSGESEENIGDVLKRIRPGDYFNFDEFEQYSKNRESLPNKFWEKIESANEEENMMELLLKIREGLFDLYGEERNNAESFSESRFISLEEMINKKLVSCGSFAKIFGTALREFKIPVKFVHDIFEDQKKLPKELENRHAWLKIYDQKNKEWLAIDPTEDSFELRSNAEEIKEYIDWDELKEDYSEGNF